MLYILTVIVALTCNLIVALTCFVYYSEQLNGQTGNRIVGKLHSFVIILADTILIGFN